MHALRQDAAILACGPFSSQVQMHAPAQDAVTLACGHSSQVQMHAARAGHRDLSMRPFLQITTMPPPCHEPSGRVQRAEQLKMDQ